MIQGEVWLREKEHFGLGTVYFDGDRTFIFALHEREASGHIVKLTTLNGNIIPLKTACIDLNKAELLLLKQISLQHNLHKILV